MAIKIHKGDAEIADWPQRGGFLGGTPLTVGSAAFHTGGIRPDGLIRPDHG